MLPKGIAIMKQETSLGRWYQRYIGKWIPMYGLLPLIGCCLFNSMIYTGTQLTLKNAYHYDLTSALDRKIPFVPEWVLIYVLSFAFWALSYCQGGEGEMVSLCGGRYDVTAFLHGIFCFLAYDKYPPAGCGGRIYRMADAPYLCFGCADQPVSVHSLSGKLVLLYRGEKEQKASCMV